MAQDDEKVLIARTDSKQEKADEMGDSGSGAGSKNEQMFRLFLLFMMTAQNSSVVLVSRYTRAGVADEDLFVINDLVMVTEFGKMILAAALEYNATNGQLMKSVKDNIIDRPLDFLRILIPSLLYLVQNSVLYIAISNLTAPLFQVTYQAKLLTTAIVSVIMLAYRPVFMKMFELQICFIPIIVNALCIVINNVKI